MALAVTALLLVALCRGLHAEPAASLNPSSQEAVHYAGEVTVPDAADAAYYDADETAALPEAVGVADEAVQSYSLPSSSGRKVFPADVDQGFLRLPAHGRRHHHHPCRHGHRHLWWARRHGLLRQDVYGFHRNTDGFQPQETQLAEVPAEPAHGEEVKLLPVAEPDPDSRRPDAAIPAVEELQNPATFHGEKKGEDEMARAWRFGHGSRFHHHHHHRRHRHHHDDQEDEEGNHEQAEEVSPMKRFRIHDDDDDGEEAETRSKRPHHDKDDEDKLEEEVMMARRWIRKALMRRRRFHHHHDGVRRRFHHNPDFRHRAEEDAAGEARSEEEEKGGVMRWLKDLVNRF